MEHLISLVVIIEVETNKMSYKKTLAICEDDDTEDTEEFIERVKQKIQEMMHLW